MAIAFARLSIHSRSKGHSAVAGAAYRAGATLTDERTGQTHSFENRSDVQYSEILLPDGSDPRFLDRETLWNEVERAERRKDSQLAKDIILALPRDLSLNDQINLARQFAKDHFVSKGLVADIAIHDHGDGNPHAHLYVTTRRLLGRQFDTHKARDLNPTFVNSRGGKGFISEQDFWGEQWRYFQNDYFGAHGIDLMVDENHLIPQRHEGRVRGNEDHYLKDDNRLRRIACQQIALNEPDTLINLISVRHAVFTEKQIASIIFKATNTQAEFTKAFHAVKAHDDIICLGPDSNGALNYTSRSNFQLESAMTDQAHAMANASHFTVSTQTIEEATLRRSLSAEQHNALSHITRGSDLSAMVGWAGTGKSYLMDAAREVWEDTGFRVQGISVSGVAAKQLESSSHIPSRTIASFKLMLGNGYLELTDRDIVVMDEAGMTNLHDMAYVLDKVSQANAKLVLIGDDKQLQSIGAGAPFSAIIHRIGFAALQDIRRQQDAGDRDASRQLALGHIDAALRHYDQKGQVHWSDKPDQAMQSLIREWQTSNDATSLKQHVILAHQNRDIIQLNQLAREQLIQKGIVSNESSDITITRRVASDDGWHIDFVNDTLTLAAGDRILFRRNDKQLGVFNGEFATVVGIDKHQLTVRHDNGQNLAIDLTTYNDIDHGYAMTVHKGQGATYNHVYVYMDGYGWNRNLAYVAMTRHRDHLSIYSNRSTFDNDQSFINLLSRDNIKDNVLDWPISYAARRGFDSESVIDRFIKSVGIAKDTVKDAWLFLTDREQFNQKQQLKHFDWASPDYHDEWKTLRHVDNKNIRWLVKYRDLMDDNKTAKEITAIKTSMDKLVAKLAKDKSALSLIRSAAPKLCRQIDHLLEKHSRDRSKGRDR